MAHYIFSHVFYNETEYVKTTVFSLRIYNNTKYCYKLLS